MPSVTEQTLIQTSDTIGSWNVAGKPLIATGNGFDVSIGEFPASSGSLARTTATVTTGSLGPNMGESGTVALAKTVKIMKVVTNIPARVRLYVTPALRDVDAGRSIGTQPGDGHGCILEVVTTPFLLNLPLSPQADGSSLEATPVNNIAYHITNLDTNTAVVSVTFTYIPIES